MRGRHRSANLRKLVRIATEYEAHDGRDLRGFLDHAATRAAFSDREGEAAATAEAHAGVRLMTIHAAKGLEFETVAVADLGRSLCRGGQPPELRLAFEPEAVAAAGGEGPPPARVGLRLARAAAASIDTEGYASLSTDAADAEAEESGRLVYVAVSRAERRLILSGVFVAGDLAESERPRRQRSALGCILPALGVDGSDAQRVTIAAPAARSGLEATFGEAAVAVSVIGAGAESAARLARDLRSGTTVGAEVAPGRPPLTGLGEGAAAAARSLSYAALADYRRCGYRFLTERVIGLDAGAPAAVPDGPGGPPEEAAERSDGREAGMGFGRAVHELLEWSCRNDWRMPPEPVRSAALGADGTPEADARATVMIEGWLRSPLLAELRDGDGIELRPEVQFRTALATGTVLRGTIDLLARPPGGGELTIVDYKTDRLGPAPGGELSEGYELQRALYAAAASEAAGGVAVRSAYVFLERPGEPIVERLDRGGIAAGRARIEGLAREIAAGRFEATERPHRDLCHDCPARRRLCPHGLELTARADPEPEVTRSAPGSASAGAPPGISFAEDGADGAAFGE